MIPPARAAALRVLARVRTGATLADALVRERDTLADARDRTLAHELATGTLRWRAALDAELAAASTRPLDRLDVVVLDILRLAVYQLRHLTRVPAHAVVDAAAEMTRAARYASAVGFVNGVLRQVARAAPGTGLPRRPPDPDADPDAALAFLSIAGSHPRWLVERWLTRHGFAATERWLAFDNAPAPLTLRANLRRTDPERLAVRLLEEGVETEPGRWSAAARVVTRGNPLATSAARDGWFVVQDEASQLVGAIAAAWGGRRRLDTCAAPGGKTLSLVEAATPEGPPFVVAGDRRPRRVRLLRDTLSRAALGHVPLVQLDLARGLPFRDVFDLVLVDAPCSGLGTLRREPDLKWRRTPGDLPAMAAVQERMLDMASRCVARGGTLVYATCSSEPEENDVVADRFLADHPGFVASGMPPLPAGTPLVSMLGADGRLRTSPVEHGLEAFFAASFTRVP